MKKYFKIFSNVKTNLYILFWNFNEIVRNVTDVINNFLLVATPLKHIILCRKFTTRKTCLLYKASSLMN